jgi:hypothetical protein
MSHPPLRPDREHGIDPIQAAEMTRRHRGTTAATATTAAAASRVTEEGSVGGLFSKRAVLALLSRSDAEFLRYYHARDESGRQTLVLVAADAKGNDLLDGGSSTLDRHWPCPPYCPEESSVLRG